MSLLFCQNGEQMALEFLLNKSSAQENMQLRLYSNNHTPANTDTAANYTEASWTGYSHVNLTGASWSVSGGNPATASYAAQTFTSTAGSQSANNYGYYVVGATSGNLYWSELFSNGPYLIQNNGDTITVTPQATAT